jgi:hypothetical protein
MQANVETIWLTSQTLKKIYSKIESRRRSPLAAKVLITCKGRK